jgi:hypothetical protein
VIRTQKIIMASRMVILSRLNTPAASSRRCFSPCPLQLSRQGGVDVPVDQVRREHCEDSERYGDHYQADAFDLEATFHQPSQRRKFSSFTSNEYPVDDLASSSPVIGETMRGIWTPMPMPLSLM